MKASELFDIVKESYLSIQPAEESQRHYDNIRSIFTDTYILAANHFYQTKPSMYIDGDLALELMFFNGQFLHNIDISPYRIDVITLPVKKITKVCLTGIANHHALLTVNVFGYNSNIADLFYKTGIERYGDLNLLRANLLRYINE
jgi:hypothetical protein